MVEVALALVIAAIAFAIGRRSGWDACAENHRIENRIAEKQARIDRLKAEIEASNKRGCRQALAVETLPHLNPPVVFLPAGGE